jgi:hypothetical protein
VVPPEREPADVKYEYIYEYAPITSAIPPPYTFKPMKDVRTFGRDRYDNAVQEVMVLLKIVKLLLLTVEYETADFVSK